MTNLVERLMLERPDDWQLVLATDYKIKIVRDGHLVSLKYNQLESPMHEPIVRQCRGMVVDTAQRQVLARPYDKFWNHGEAAADEIDWATARVQEKLDGSLMIMYWGTGGWRVASSGHPTAGGPFGKSPADDDEIAPEVEPTDLAQSGRSTFRDAFVDAWMELGYRLPPTQLKHVSFMFELCDAPNRVVVKHERRRLVLHGARNLDGQEFDHAWCETIAREHGWEHVQSFPIASIQDCLAAAEALDPLKQEGFIVVDALFRRVKIKSPRYVTLHHLKGEMTTRRAIELWKSGEASELLAHFPEFAAEVEAVHAELDAVAEQAVRDYLENTPRASRKEFANAVKDLPTAKVLFLLVGEETPSVNAAKAIMRRFTTAALGRLL